MAASAYQTDGGLFYPLTKMNFLVHVDQVEGTAAFSEVTGIEATVDVIEFRQGNANSLAPVKIPGLVRKYTGKMPEFYFTSGGDFPEKLSP